MQLPVKFFVLSDGNGNYLKRSKIKSGSTRYHYAYEETSDVNNLFIFEDLANFSDSILPQLSKKYRESYNIVSCMLYDSASDLPLNIDISSVTKVYMIGNSARAYLTKNDSGKIIAATDILSCIWHNSPLAFASLLKELPARFQKNYKMQMFYLIETPVRSIIPKYEKGVKLESCNSEDMSPEPVSKVVGIQNFREPEESEDLVETLNTTLQGLVSFSSTLKSLYAQANQLLSDSDLTVTDLLHYIEFNQLNAYDGFLTYRKLREVLLKRRQAKHIIFSLKHISEGLPEETMIKIEDAMNLSNSISSENLKYKPRKLTELFKEEEIQ